MHTTIFSSSPPKIGELIWCRRCTEYQRVTVAPPEYRVRCRSCRLSRPFGRAKLTAEVFAAKHHTRNPAHTVALYDGQDVVQELRPQEQGLWADRSQSDNNPPF